MNRVLGCLFLLVSLASGEETLPDGPKPQPTGRKLFYGAVIASAMPVYLDAWSTARIGERPTDPCYGYEQNATWYGKYPARNPARVYAVMSGELVAATLGSYLLRRHKITRKFWIAPLAYVATMHSLGAAHNLRRCTP